MLSLGHVLGGAECSSGAGERSTSLCGTLHHSWWACRTIWRNWRILRHAQEERGWDGL